ncbi:uncharacterized protein [Mytilus edulis]|uniref:uncharacterized protein n=1 Tax=Mytilus edulis TaxID=6550 RepID=UPI0039F0D075
MASSFVKRASYHITSEEDIFKIPDVKTAMMLLKSWGLETKGLRTKDQALQRILDHWRTISDEQQKQSDEKINRYVKDSSEKLKSNIEKLVSKFESMIKFYKQLSLTHQKSICESYKNIEEIARSKIHNLKNSQSALVISGELGSGQTSFINLLLQSDILPVEEEGCTRTYCELKQGGEPKATLYSKDPSTMESKVTVLDMKDQTSKKTLNDFITSANEMIYHEKVTIEYPFEFLESGIHVLDIPDHIDTSIPLEDIISVLPPNVVFIYVLDFSKREHIETGKVEDFIAHVCRTSQHGFSYEDVMVVCNKCDVIPEEQLDDAKINARDQLLKTCPELKDDQIAFLSVKEEQRLEPSGIHSEDFQAVCKAIHNSFLKKMEQYLKKEYRWLSQVQKRALYILKVSKLNSNKTLEERREMMAQVEVRIEKLEKESRLIIGRLHEEVDMEIDRLYNKVVDYLNSTDLKSSMTVWLDDQCPKPDRKWKHLKCAAENSIVEKLREKLNEWEKSSAIKLKIQKQIINKFSEEVELMETHMKKIGAMLACGDSTAVVNLHRSFKHDSPVNLRSSPQSSTSKPQKDKNKLSDFVCGIGGFDKTVKKEIKPIFNKYKKETRTHLMFKATDIYLRCLIKNPQLKETVGKYIKRFSKDINKIAKMIPDLIAMDKRLMSSLESEVMETKETIHVIPENLRRCLVLQGELDLFYVYEMWQLDYRLRDLEWNEKRKLGTGSFANVYPGHLNTNGEKVEVAIKMFKDPLQTNNISELLLEDETLRELEHDNIIKYYGATILQKGSPQKTYWIMIMASCITNLKEIYLDKKSPLKEDIPCKQTKGTMEYEKAKTAMVHYVVQLCEGVSFLHGKKLVHRDLKLENILVTKNKEIKLTDVGLTKPEEDISGTFVGSPVYMAPEVHEQKSIYNRKADIYSLAMVLWEMWYGKSINDELDGKVRGRLSVEIRGGTRPMFTEDQKHTKPPDEWITFIGKCWAANPKFRPKAKLVAEFFKDSLLKTVHFV